MSSAISFKEWQVVCDALASGRQSILLRKGGIHEGRQGFSFAHESFFLFPTRFHALADQVREGDVKVMPEWQPGDMIRITHHAEAAWAVTLTDWEKVSELEPFHIYSEQTVRDRFDWEGKGMASGSIHLALVRIRELAAPWEFPYETKYGGCRSWVNLPEPPAGWRENVHPVLDDGTFMALEERVR
ncbi:MAG: DUF1802 family protein [Luteolibacter sp.]|uniref:DUF1802 family protein n=1 Tax=Luteolibacter sp. TaxID=1962973 RepID=UPI003263EAB0